MENIINLPGSNERCESGTVRLEQHSTNKTTHREDGFIEEADKGPVRHDTIISVCQAQLRQDVVTQNATNLLTWPEELQCLLIDYAIKIKRPTLILACNYLYQLSFKMKCNTLICEDKALVTDIIEQQDKTRPLYAKFFGLVKEKPFEEMTWTEKYTTYPALRLSRFRAAGCEGVTNLRSLEIASPFMIFRISNGNLTIPDAVKIKTEWITDILKDPTITPEIKSALSNQVVKEWLVDEVVTNLEQLQIIGSNDFLASCVNDDLLQENWIKKNVFINPIWAERFLKDANFREVVKYELIRDAIDKKQITINQVWNSARAQTGKFMLSKYYENYRADWQRDLFLMLILLRKYLVIWQSFRGLFIPS